MSEVRRYIGFDDAAVLNETTDYEGYIKENPRHPIYVLASDYDSAVAVLREIASAPIFDRRAVLARDWLREHGEGGRDET